jgi:hypothetical protein
VQKRHDILMDDDAGRLGVLFQEVSQVFDRSFQVSLIVLEELGHVVPLETGNERQD